MTGCVGRQGRRKPDFRESRRRRGRWHVAASILCLAAATAFAQSASPGSTVLEEIVVVGHRDALARRVASLPGGADLVSVEDVASTANLTVSRALAGTPGVVIQDFFGANDQPRIQIRGSGLQQNPVERGVLVLQNGLPINRADGSYVVGFANPSQAEAVEVYRGYLANRLGATVLGGALNFISPTGRSAAGGTLAMSGGSFGQLSALGGYGWSTDGYDVLMRADVSRRDGYRDHNESRRVRVGGNVGVRLSDTVSIRFFADYTDLDFDVSGPLTAGLLAGDPESVFTGPTVTPSGAINPGPNVVRDRPRRQAEQWLAGSRATISLGADVLDLALGYSRTDDSFRFPVSSGVRDTQGDDVTAVLRYAHKLDAAGLLPLFEVTAQYVAGSADRDYYLNLSGEKGARFAANELDADSLSLSAGFHFPVSDSVTISPSISWSDASRDNEDVWRQATRPTAAYHPANPAMALPAGAVPAVSNRYHRDYEGWSPALGVSWQPDEGNLIFAAISRSFEPPTHDDLSATINGTPNSSPGRPNPADPAFPAAVFATPDLDAQQATTVEAGWRGSGDDFSWDATAYYSWVDNELLSLRDASGARLGAINADDTRHFGVELALAARVTSRLAGRVVYNYQDFRFHDDPLRGDNRLAGAPRHWLHASVRYSLTERWSAGTGVRWMMEKTPIDNLNTVYNDPYAVVDLLSEYQVNDAFLLFGEVTNVFDETYASSTLITDQARPDQAAYLPGDGRAAYAGARFRF